jgi:hypothetical protein
MNREGFNQVDFFFGTEIENSPAKGYYTLFVVGVQTEDRIVSALNIGAKPIGHIYFAANHSFPGLGVNDYRWQDWTAMILPFLQKGYLCTLDVDSSCAEGLCESGLTEYNNFIPMISVKLPYIQLLGYNATIKLDDKDFAATNPGVWCHSLHELRSREAFTNWAEYSKDEIK